VRWPEQWPYIKVSGHICLIIHGYVEEAGLRLEFDVPDLSGLQQHSSRLALRRAFQNSGPKDLGAYALVLNATRLSDLAIREYEQGRSMLVSLVTETGAGLDYAVAASGHFETCLSALHRALRHLDALRRFKPAPVELKRLIPVDLVERNRTIAREVSDLRDAILHLDERIIKGKLSQGEALCLLPTKEGLELGAHQLPFELLAKWLRRLHDCSSCVADFSERADATAAL
jgi:hypothetical protein